MHREIAHADSAFAQERPYALYLATAFLALLVGMDLAPRLGVWLGIPSLAAFPGELLGYRFALIAAVLGGARVLYGSLNSLMEGRLGADLALAIACIAAILMNEPLVAAEVVFIGMLGECLEAYTFDRTQRAVRTIVEVFPIRCWRLENGQEVRVFTRDLRVGDVVVVKPGGKIPVDGIVQDGRSAVDVGPLTGESLPQDKGVGDQVLAGSVNQNGALTILAQHVAQQTVAGKVIELTARALQDKTSGERIADRLARWFLPVVLALAAATFLGAMLHFSGGWFRAAGSPRLGWSQAVRSSMIPTLAVLVVSCPCALILATPAAIIAALGRLAGTGVLIKGGSALERLAAVTAFAFDKTGTITEGKLELGDVLPMPGVAPDELLRLAAAAERLSEHPLARVVLEAAKSRGSVSDAEADQFMALPGAGVAARVGGATVLVGARRLLEERDVVLDATAHALLAQLDASGQTALLIARDGRFLGVVGARDRVRPEAAGVVAALRELGIAPIVLLTGDRKAAAESAARDLGFDSIGADLLPQDKAAQIEEWKAAGRRCAMVGDGINDAPALARADVGLALGGAGVDLTAEAGDVLLLGDPLRTLPLLVKLARQTVRILRQNILWFGFGVNLVGIVLTSWLWPVFAPAKWSDQSPLAAVLYHQIGSFLVLLNSMRLLWFERESSQRSWAKTKAAWNAFDGWLDRHFDLDAWIHTLEHHWRRALGIALALVAAIGLASGIIAVGPDEHAVLVRWGRPVADLEPGWHWRWPWPIESDRRVSRRVRTVEIGFREAPEQTKAPASWTWTSSHRKENRLSRESTMIAGDGNLLDLQAIVRFRVVDPKAFLFDAADAEEILRADAETTLRTLVAGQAFQDLLTSGRTALQDETLRRLQAKAAAYGPRGLGLEVEGLSLLDLHPPAEVVPSYYAVAEAVQGRDRRVNEAEKRALKRRKEAEGEARTILAKAKAAAAEKTAAASGEAFRFLSASRGSKELAWTEEGLLWLEGAAAAAKGEPAEAVRERIRLQRASLQAHRQNLAQFRLYWEAMGSALARRDLILIDRDKIGGRRNLFLTDPELLRPPGPMLLAPERPAPKFEEP